MLYFLNYLGIVLIVDKSFTLYLIFINELIFYYTIMIGKADTVDDKDSYMYYCFFLAECI